MNEENTNEGQQKLRRRLRGVVKSAACNKGAVVVVSRVKMHKRYLKKIRWSKNYLVHDEENKCVVGDKVEIVECRPRSRRKFFELAKVLEGVSAA